MSYCHGVAGVGINLNEGFGKYPGDLIRTRLANAACIDCSCSTNFYRDADGDGFGDENDSVVECEAPEGYVDNKEDCDDTSAEIGAYSYFYRDADEDGFGDPSDS